MKRLTAIILILLMISPTLVGCTKFALDNEANSESDSANNIQNSESLTDTVLDKDVTDKNTDKSEIGGNNKDGDSESDKDEVKKEVQKTVNTVSWEPLSKTSTSNEYSDCITYRTPLTNTYNCLTKDKKLNVVYFGGSLTNGYGCTDINVYSWRALSGKWLKDNFPDANVKTIDTAIGESGTYLGVYRTTKDVIGSNPDLLFIEYAINDYYYDNDENKSAMRFETIVREVRKALPYCDIVVLLTTEKALANTSNSLGLFPSARGHDKIAKAYGLTVLNIGSAMVRNLAKKHGNNWWNNSSTWNSYFVDSVHPNNAGHEQYYLCVKEYLENELKHTNYSKANKKIRNIPYVQSDSLLDGNRQSIGGKELEKVFLQDKSQNATCSTDSFFHGTSQTPQNGYVYIPKNGYATFEITGTELAIWATIRSPQKYQYSINGGNKVTVSAYSHAPSLVTTDLPFRTHTITIYASECEIYIGSLFVRDQTKQTLKSSK